MELRTGSRLYWLWASTFRLFWRRPPKETDTCAVLRRVILIPVIWPAGAIFRTVTVLLFAAFFTGYFIIGVPIGLFVGYRPYLAVPPDGVRYWSMRKYRGWQLGPFELHPWHALILAALAWTAWIGWYGYVHWSDKHVPKGLWTSFWWTVGIVGTILIMTIFNLIGRMFGLGLEWTLSLKGRLCTPVTVVDDRSESRT